jgi:UPF0042 nucleotide-binding protein
MSDDGARTVFVAGLSGSGKSTAMAALEDLAFYCVENLPAQLMVDFLDLCAKASPRIRNVALSLDTREEPFLRRFPEVVRELRGRGAAVEVIFLDSTNEALVNRYRETRRVHPLAPGGSVEAGIERERELLVDAARLADRVIDTSALNVHQLKHTVVEQVAGKVRRSVVNLVSFGFRYGPPPSVDLMFDVRFLPNPYFVEHLRSKTGMDAEVASYVLTNPRGAALFERLSDFLAYLLPQYDQEGKAYVTVGIGCTGGQHRSVSIACALVEHLKGHEREVNVEHRDVARAK